MVIGGTASLLGPIVGAFVYYRVNEFTRELPDKTWLPEFVQRLPRGPAQPGHARVRRAAHPPDVRGAVRHRRPGQAGRAPLRRRHPAIPVSKTRAGARRRTWRLRPRGSPIPRRRAARCRRGGRRGRRRARRTAGRPGARRPRRSAPGGRAGWRRGAPGSTVAVGHLGGGDLGGVQEEVTDDHGAGIPVAHPHDVMAGVVAGRIGEVHAGRDLLVPVGGLDRPGVVELHDARGALARGGHPSGCPRSRRAGRGSGRAGRWGSRRGGGSRRARRCGCSPPRRRRPPRRPPPAGPGGAGRAARGRRRRGTGRPPRRCRRARITVADEPMRSAQSSVTNAGWSHGERCSAAVVRLVRREDRARTRGRRPG